MKITRELRSAPQERCHIDLEQDFPTRTAALDAIYGTGLLTSDAVLSELHNADAPNIWITFTIKGRHSILGIDLLV